MFQKSRLPGFQSLLDLCWKFYCLTGNHLVIWISTYFNQHPPGRTNHQSGSFHFEEKQLETANKYWHYIIYIYNQFGFEFA